MTVSGVGYLAFKNRNHESEATRIAIAGCFANLTVETGFHMIDTVNIRSKANP
jgi:hypothetical protein